MDIYVVYSFKITLEIIKIKSPTYLHFFVFIFLRRNWPRRTPRSTGIPRFVLKVQSNNVCSFRGIVFDTQFFCLPLFLIIENEVKKSQYAKKGLLSSLLLRGEMQCVSNFDSIYCTTVPQFCFKCYFRTSGRERTGRS